MALVEQSLTRQNIAIPKKIIGPAATLATPIEAPSARTRNAPVLGPWTKLMNGVSIKIIAMLSSTTIHEDHKKML